MSNEYWTPQTERYKKANTDIPGIEHTHRMQLQTIDYISKVNQRCDIKLTTYRKIIKENNNCMSLVWNKTISQKSVPRIQLIAECQNYTVSK